MPERGGPDPIGEARRAMDALVSSAAGVAGRAPIPHQLVEAMQRQLHLLEEIAERERRLQREVAERVTAPMDAVFDLLEESASTMRGQAEAIEAAGYSLAETAALMRRQAELFERSVAGLREPLELAKSAAGAQSRRR